jgi:hypothetical protein
VSDVCIWSGETVPPETEISYWLYPYELVVHVYCPSCDNKVSVNRTSKTFRKHSASPQLISR